MDERGALVEHLEGQIQDLLMELDEAQEHINWHHNHEAHHDASEEMEIDEGPEEIEGVSDLDEEEAAMAPGPQVGENHSEVGSPSSVNNLDDF